MMEAGEVNVDWLVKLVTFFKVLRKNHGMLFGVSGRKLATGTPGASD